MESSKNKRSEALTGHFEAALGRHVAAGQHLVVGLSGGVDSTVLLHLLMRAAPAHRLSLSAIHVHHGLSANADAWAEHCGACCSELGVPLSIERVDVERGSRDGLEAAARRARHQAFAGVAADWIVLAHHRDDQAETLLFNLLRGTGLRGAAAMNEVNGRLLRPLLGTGRTDLEDYAVAHGLRWIDDESNADTAHSRNFLRHETLHALEGRFPGCSANLAGASRRFAEAHSLLDDLAQMDLGERGDFPIVAATWTALPEPRARNVLRYLLQRRHIGIPSEERLREIVRQLREAGPDRHPSTDFGRWRLLRRAGQILVEPAQVGD